jgi:Secretion system C-terminal sorting domain
MNSTISNKHFAVALWEDSRLATGLGNYFNEQSAFKIKFSKTQYLKNALLLLIFQACLSNIAYAQICNETYPISNVNQGFGMIKHTQNTFTDNRKEFYIYDDGTYSDYNNPSHRYVGTSGSADAHLIRGYNNGPKKLKFNNTTASGGYYQDVFPGFTGPIFVKTSWGHSISTDNNCNAPYYAIVIQNCTPSTVTTGSVEFYYKSAEAYVSTNNPIKAYFPKNSNWFNTTPLTQITPVTIPITPQNPYDRKISVSFTNLQVNERRAIYIPLAHNNLALNEEVHTYTNVIYNGVQNPCAGGDGGSGYLHASKVKPNPHDPNLIDVVPKCLYLNPGPGQFANHRIIYTIHFQNEGLGDANDIRIVDILPKVIDRNSVVLLDSKFPVTSFQIDYQSNLEIKYDDIDLPGTQNPIITGQGVEKTKGWVKFAVCPRIIASQLGEDPHDPHCIDNYAAIYFDQEPAVYTAMATTCESATCAYSYEETNQINAVAACPGNAAMRSSNQHNGSVSPNPFVDEINIFDEMLAGKCMIDVVNLQGQTIYSDKVEGNEYHSLKIDAASFNSGLYLVTIKNGKDYKTYKVYKN